MIPSKVTEKAQAHGVKGWLIAAALAVVVVLGFIYWPPAHTSAVNAKDAAVAYVCENFPDHCTDGKLKPMFQKQ